MDTDKNGKVSKEEFLKFMEAEFDYADKRKNGQLDPNELKHLLYQVNYPYRPRLGK
jgi:Ca2+-binding EF-hand superfamily protein